MSQIRETIEQFHLLFLDQLGKKLDKRLYSLKGGCNLRFYFKSIRYSEDLDLDVHTINTNTLKKNVTQILEGSNFRKILVTKNITLDNFAIAKNSSTTQRFKISLKVKGQSISLPTKIEFSRRGFLGNTLYENIDLALTQNYNLLPILLSHYDKNSALLQKIYALSNRNITQARDIFDIYLLLTLGAKITDKIDIAVQNTALQNLELVKYQDFLAQVVAFLEPQSRETYTPLDRWQNILSTIKDKFK